ncbi:MAG: hypothetical protein P1V51_06480 [Deltaproteobacteria bacterium]|nr:hypothetical protein [Deltaproteobacteria bacterium]
MNEATQAETALPPVPPAEHLTKASVGDLIDRALRLYRANFRTFFLVMLVAQLPIYLLQKIYETVLRSAMPVGGLRPELVTPEIALEVLATLGVAFPLTFLGMMFLLAVAYGAIIHGGDQAWRGGVPLTSDVARGIQARLGAVVLTYLLVQVFFFIGGVAGMVPGLGLVVAGALSASSAMAILGLLVALLGAFVVVLVLYLRWYLILPVVVLEGGSGLAALRRSTGLMAGRVDSGILGLVKMRASLLLLVLFLLLAIPGLLIGVPQYLVAAAYTPAGMPPDVFSIPFVVRLPFDIAQIFLSSVLTPLGILAMVFFYFDLRIRREGLDLELQASRLAEAGQPLAAVPVEPAALTPETPRG